VASGTSLATRTRSNREPGLLSIAPLMSAGSILSSEASFETTSSRRSSGRSTGRIFTANVGTFFTRSTPFRS
jgi:hypothetical protein